MSLTDKIVAVLIAFLLAVIAGGCAKTALEEQPTNNSELSVAVLCTDKDGYTLKRVDVGGQKVFYVTPGPARVSWNVSSGKSVVPHAVETAP